MVADLRLGVVGTVAAAIAGLLDSAEFAIGTKTILSWLLIIASFGLVFFVALARPWWSETSTWRTASAIFVEQHALLLRHLSESRTWRLFFDRLRMMTVTGLFLLPAALFLQAIGLRRLQAQTAALFSVSSFYGRHFLQPDTIVVWNP